METRQVNRKPNISSYQSASYARGSVSVPKTAPSQYEKTSKKAISVKKNKKKLKNKSHAKWLLYIAVTFVLGFWLVGRYVAMYETGNAAQKAKAEFSQIQTKNEQLKLQIDKAVDLKVLETIATDRLGMIRPERYQLFYIDMNTVDFGEKISTKKILCLLKRA